jgi:hypothetical protein
MNAAVLKNSALRTLTSRTSPDDCLVKSARPSVVAAIDARLLVARDRASGLPLLRSPGFARRLDPRRARLRSSKTAPVY